VVGFAEQQPNRLNSLVDRAEEVEDLEAMEVAAGYTTTEG
jgi:hypothetical protein